MDIKAKRLKDVTIFVNEEVCPDCGGDGFFEHVQASHFGRHGEPIDYEVFEKEECQKCKGKGVVENE
tara:strand:- start:1556 stop:1756 length:201 start_codon:yes stop_codon:yes gene_type:complete